MGGQSFAEYQAALSNSVYPMKLELGGSEAPFRAGLASRSLGELALVKAYANADLQCERQSRRNADDNGYYVLQLQKSGATSYLHSDRTAVCGTDTFVLMDARRSIVGQQFGAADVLMVKIPVRTMAALIPRADDYCSVAVSAKSGSAGILARMLQECWYFNRSFTDHDHRILPGSLLRLVEAIFYGTGFADDTMGVTQRRQYDRIRRAIADHAGDPELNPSHLAMILGQSRSSLYAVTRAAGTTIEAMIVDTRLDQVSSCLADPAHATCSLTAIAFDHGFQDLSHFSRRFKQRFGDSPSVFRQKLLDNTAFLQVG